MNNRDEMLNENHYFELINDGPGGFGIYELYDNVREALRGLLEASASWSEVDQDPRSKWIVNEVTFGEDIWVDDDSGLYKAGGYWNQDRTQKRIFVISDKNLMKSNEEGL